jgi:hypothetical protein
LPRCGEEQPLRLFVTEELIEAGVSPETLMEAQGFDPAPLALLKANFSAAARPSRDWAGKAANGLAMAIQSRGRVAS